MPNRALIAAVAALVVVLGALLAVRARRVPPGPAGVAEAAPPHDAAGQVAASRENVSPRFASEVAVLRQRVAADPADTAALLRLARLHQDGHQPAVSAGYYRRYLASAPADRQAWLDLAAVEAAAGNLAAALSATDTLLTRDSLDPAALYNRGALLANRGDTAAAVRWWRKAAAQARDRAVAERAGAALRQVGGRP